MAEKVGNVTCDVDKWFDILNSFVKEGSVPTKSAYGVHFLKPQFFFGKRNVFGSKPWLFLLARKRFSQTRLAFSDSGEFSSLERFLLILLGGLVPKCDGFSFMNFLEIVNSC